MNKAGLNLPDPPWGDRHLTQIVFVVTLGPPASCLKGKPLLLNMKLFGGQQHDNYVNVISTSDVSLCVSVSSLVQLPQHPARPGSQLLPCTLQLEKLGRKMSECIWKGWTARGRRWDTEFDTFLLLSLFFITSLSELCPLVSFSKKNITFGVVTISESNC